MKNKEALFTTKEVAAYLNAGESSVRMWCLEGRFKNAKRIGRDWVVPFKDLIAFKKLSRGRPRKTTMALAS